MVARGSEGSLDNQWFGSPPLWLANVTHKSFGRFFFILFFFQFFLIMIARAINYSASLES